MPRTKWNETNKLPPAVLKARLAVFDVVLARIQDNRQRTISILSDLDQDSLVAVANNLAGLCAGLGVQMHDGDRAGAANHVRQWRDLCALDPDLQAAADE